MPMRGQRTAIVLGASIAGCVAARVVADHFDEVVIMDRDTVAGVRTPRRGTPHAGHAHGLHGRGYLAIAELFPGILDEAVAAGMTTRDIGEMHWYFDGLPTSTVKTGLTSIVGARSILEDLLRERVTSLPGVRLLEGHRAVGLTHDDFGERVTGVRVVAETGERLLRGALVIDATGRGSSASTWLDQLGYGKPQVEEMKIRLAYTTARFRLHEGLYGRPRAINPVAGPNYPRGGFFGQMHNGEAVVSLTGIGGDRPPSDREAFLEFARDLPAPEVHQALLQSDQLAEARTFNIPTSRWTHFELMPKLPWGFVAVGDAVCSFNPVYGQGMTVAALQALELRDALLGGHEPSPMELAHRVAAKIADPWMFSTEGDLAFASTPGRRGLDVRLRNGYRRRVIAAAHNDTTVTEAYLRVVALDSPPSSLWSPTLVSRVARCCLTQTVRRWFSAGRNPRSGRILQEPSTHSGRADARESGPVRGTLEDESQPDLEVSLIENKEAR